MPNIKSAEKRVRTSIVRQMRNKSDRSRLKTTLKQFDAALENGDTAVVTSAYQQAVKTVDQAVTKGLIHKNNAARKKSSLTRRLAAASK